MFCLMKQFLCDKGVGLRPPSYVGLIKLSGIENWNVFTKEELLGIFGYVFSISNLDTSAHLYLTEGRTASTSHRKYKTAPFPYDW